MLKRTIQRPSPTEPALLLSSPLSSLYLSERVIALHDTMFNTLQMQM